MGLQVHGVYLPAPKLGLWSPSESRIYFDMRLTPAERRSVVAHELGHAHHGHTCDGAKQERQADTYAALLLIAPGAYARLESIGLSITDIAEELDVTERIVTAYTTHCLSRIGDATYRRPKMGFGQWQFRSA